MTNSLNMADIWDKTVHEITHVLTPHGPLAPDGVTHLYAPSDFSVHFFLQLAIIIVTCRVVGWIGQKLLGQPQVVGEMIAGVILGPSLFGLLFPEIQGAIFPKEMKNVLYTGAQFGVGLYMFMVGTSFRGDHFKSKGKSAMLVSFAGITAPFLLAILLAPWLMTVPGLFAEGISQFNATLFLGACIALTAFPMLARIINERGLANSSLGTLSLTAVRLTTPCRGAFWPSFWPPSALVPVLPSWPLSVGCRSLCSLSCSAASCWRRSAAWSRPRAR